jgi:hypothetical protein
VSGQSRLYERKNAQFVATAATHKLVRQMISNLTNLCRTKLCPS